MMNLYHNILAFSPRGDYLAYSSPDGCLKIWATSTGTLKQEYTPSSHLSATCSTLSWGPSKRNLHRPKSPKKKRSNALSEIENLQFIAMGTMTGDILLYSFTKAELYTSLTDGHTNAVNDVCWSDATQSLYTCSNDQHIISWDIISGKIKTKWKADKGAIYSICLIDENNLLSASNTISWWNIKEKTVIKNFSGHATETFRLLPVNVKDTSSNNYFLSAALGDRVLNAWQLSVTQSKGKVASFVSSCEPGNIDIMVKENEPLRMSVVTKDGLFHLFEHVLNGRSKKPLQPKLTIHIASEKPDASTKPKPVPILTSYISQGLDSCLLVYGTFLKPMFETINISDASKDVFLIRDLSFSSAVSIQDSITGVKQTEKPSNVKMLAPGHMTDVNISESVSRKRKQTSTDVQEMPMEERLKALDLSTTPKDSQEEPAVKSDSMVHLLLQGLQSKDSNMLNTVLHCGDEAVIQNTLRRLPLHSILSLLKEIYERLNKQESRSHPGLLWLKGLLSIHLPYLMSCKDVDEYLGPISQLIEARTENFSKMSRLRGCLEILLSQANSCSYQPTELPTTPLAEYISESSAESAEESEASENTSDNVIDASVNDESETSDSESEMETET